MHLDLKRTTFSKESTIGELFVDGAFECYVLEDVVRQPGEAKVFGKTAIPAGTYQVKVTYSNRFRRLLPLLVNVAGGNIQFGGRRIDECGVRIHSGNKPEDTEGCLLPGTRLGADGRSVEASRVAFDALFAKINAALAGGEKVTLTIK